MIEILSVRNINDITDAKIQKYINNTSDPSDPSDHIPAIMSEYEEMRKNIGLTEDNTELDKISDLINKLNTILPHNTNLYELYIFILALIKTKLDNILASINILQNITK